MIPNFPEFKKIDIKDKADITLFTNKYRPYSDFNFTSLFAWNTNNQRMVSILNKNLVILFTDYTNEEYFFSFLGTFEQENTLQQLFLFSKEKGISPVLKLVPEESISTLSDTNIIIKEDRDNFDYIYSISQLSHLKGNALKTKRQLSKKFLLRYPDVSFMIKDIDDTLIQTEIISVLNRWERQKNKDEKVCEIEQEKIAINRLLKTASAHKLILSCIYFHHTLIGFSIDEIISQEYATSHFIKADINYVGVYEFFNQKIAQYLNQLNVLFWNWEQDLNIENLKRSKSSYQPVHFLKKYEISQNLQSTS